MTIYRNIYLIGFRASGKTTLARRISLDTGLTFLDTDLKLQKKAKMSIEKMVAMHGWNYFRDLEEEILAETATRQRLIVATGGGIVLRESNRNILKAKTNLTVYLKADRGLILDRLEADPGPDQRPPLSILSREQEVTDILTQREPLYEECADVILSAREDLQSLSLKVAGLIH
jgi:shikimate kinase